MSASAVPASRTSAGLSCGFAEPLLHAIKTKKSPSHARRRTPGLCHHSFASQLLVAMIAHARAICRLFARRRIVAVIAHGGTTTTATPAALDPHVATAATLPAAL